MVIAYEMQREIVRTFRSLSPTMQEGVESGDYEVVVVDNGSGEPIDCEAACAATGVQLRWLRIDDASPSPAAAANVGLRAARAPLVGVMIDGARLASPGLLSHALAAGRLHPRPLILTHGFHLGDRRQQDSVPAGYDQRAEDELLARVDWTGDGYRLFEVSVLSPSSRDGWFAAPYESNAIFMPAAVWEELGGFDERFRSPGGGLVNLDLLARACELPEVQTIVLLGEATFHQVHGGVSTNVPESRWEAFHDEYVRIRGRSYRRPDARPLFLGSRQPPVARRGSGL